MAFSPLNHQIQVIYANMVFDESFEQSLSDLGGARSLGWSGDAAWVNDSAAFNGNVSVRLEPATRLSNRGLYHQGFALEAGEPHRALLAARAAADAARSNPGAGGGAPGGRLPIASCNLQG